MNLEKKSAIVLVSGGMDSCVTAAIAKGENEDIAFLHISYGQRTERRERKAFNDIADFYNIEKRLDVSIEYLTKIGGSSLTDNSIEVSEADLESTEIPTSYVPFRNANMLAIATSWAEVLKANAIYVGAVFEDSSGYPDCRPEFFAAFEKTIETGTKPDTNIKIKHADYSFIKSRNRAKRFGIKRADSFKLVVLQERRFGVRNVRFVRAEVARICTGRRS